MRSSKPTLAIIIGVLLILLFVAIASYANTAITGNSDKRVKALENFQRKQQTKVNPGLSAVMLEYSAHMNKLWFAGQAGNWDLARFEIDKVKEVQGVGEIDRPVYAPQLKDFEKKYLDAIGSAVNAKDLAKFNSAYINAINGCNDCHMKSKAEKFPNLSFIKIQVPMSDVTGGLQTYSGR